MQHFVDQRLFVVAAKASGLPYAATVIHDIILRHWRRAAAVISKQRTFISWRKRFQDQFNADIEAHVPPAEALQGKRLQEAETFLRSHRRHLEDRQLDYIQGAADAQRASARRRLMLAVAVSALLLVSLFFSVLEQYRPRLPKKARGVTERHDPADRLLDRSNV